MVAHNGMDNATINIEPQTHENEALMQSVQENIKPHLEDGERLIWRCSFRWHDENGQLRGHYEMQSAPYLCDTFGYELVHDLNHIAVVRQSNDSSAVPTPSSDERAIIQAIKSGLNQHLREGEFLIWRDDNHQWRDEESVLDCDDHTQTPSYLFRDINDYLLIHNFESVAVIHKNYFSE